MAKKYEGFRQKGRFISKAENKIISKILVEELGIKDLKSVPKELTLVTGKNTIKEFLKDYNPSYSFSASNFDIEKDIDKKEKEEFVLTIKKGQKEVAKDAFAKDFLKYFQEQNRGKLIFYYVRYDYSNKQYIIDLNKTIVRDATN